MAENEYQKKIVDDAINVLKREHKVGLDIFTRGGKSYIAMDIIEHLMSLENNKNKLALIIAPKSIMINLRDNVMSHFKYKNKLVFLNYEKLSHGVTILNYLKDNGINPDNISTIVLDEAHRAFGEICRATFLVDEEFIYSKYVIAMTATPYSNISGIQSLDTLIGEGNTIRYHYDEAIKDKVARKINYIPAILSYSDKVNKRVNTIKSEYSNNKQMKTLLTELDEKNKIIESDPTTLIKNYITENVKLSAANGARVFVFFNSIDKINEYKNTVTNAILQAYKEWGNKKVKTRFMNFTSQSTDDEIEDIREKLAAKPLKNTIDIICTVQMGVMGIHPSNTHFALIVSCTTSIQRLMQMIGRVTNLYAYDDVDTTVFDMKDNISLLSKRMHGYDFGIGNRSTNLINTMYSEGDETGNNTGDNIGGEECIQQYSSIINLKQSKIATDSFDLLEKIDYIANVLENADDMIEFVKQHIDAVDKYRYGNIASYFQMKQLASTTDYERRKYVNLGITYKQLITIVFNKSYDIDIRKLVRSKLNQFGYRIYLNGNAGKETCDRIQHTYELCRKAFKSKTKSDELINDVIERALTGNISADERKIIVYFRTMKLFTESELQEIANKLFAEAKEKESKQRELEEKERKALEEVINAKDSNAIVLDDSTRNNMFVHRDESSKPDNDSFGVSFEEASRIIEADPTDRDRIIALFVIEYLMISTNKKYKQGKDLLGAKLAYHTSDLYRSNVIQEALHIKTTSWAEFVFSMYSKDYSKLSSADIIRSLNRIYKSIKLNGRKCTGKDDVVINMIDMLDVDISPENVFRSLRDFKGFNMYAEMQGHNLFWTDDIKKKFYKFLGDDVRNNFDTALEFAVTHDIKSLCTEILSSGRYEDLLIHRRFDVDSTIQNDLAKVVSL